MKVKARKGLGGGIEDSRGAVHPSASRTWDTANNPGGDPGREETDCSRLIRTKDLGGHQSPPLGVDGWTTTTRNRQIVRKKGRNYQNGYGHQMINGNQTEEKQSMSVCHDKVATLRVGNGRHQLESPQNPDKISTSISISISLASSKQRRASQNTTTPPSRS